MSTKRDYRVVEMSFDNKDFERNAQQSIKTLQNLNKALEMKGATQGLNDVEKAAASINLKPIEGAVTDLTSAFVTLGAVAVKVLLNSFSIIKTQFDKMWDSTIGRVVGQIKSGGSARALNIANAQFKLEGLGIDWEKASADINQAVDGTAYAFDAAANTASQLATAGIELGDAYGGMAHALKAVSGIAAMTNSSYEEIGYIFAQIASAGRLMGQDAMQISTRGINVTATLAKQLNKTTDEITEMQRKGEISFAMFAEAMNDAFGEQATKANNTFQGAMSNVKSALSRIGEIFYGPFYDAMIGPLNAIREAINKIKKAFSDGDDATRDFKDRLTELMQIASKTFVFFVEKVDFKGVYLLANALNHVLDIIIAIGRAWEKILGIFDSKKAVSENAKLQTSIENLTQAELDAAKAIWETNKYGTGQTRIDKLKEAGFDEESISRIQGAVDKFISSNYSWAESEKAIAETTAEANKEWNAQEHNTRAAIFRTLENGFDTLKNIVGSVLDIVKALGNIGATAVKSFLAAFHFEEVGKDILDISKKIKSFTENLVSLTRDNVKIRKVFDDIFSIGNNLYRLVVSIFGIMKEVVVGFATALKDSLSGFDIGSLSLGNLSDKVATFAEHLKDVISNSQIFVKIFKDVIGFIKLGIGLIKSIPSMLRPVFVKIINAFSAIADKIKDVTGIDIKGKIGSLIEVIKKFFDALKDPFATDETGQTSISKWAENAKKTLLNVFDNPKEVFEKVKDWFFEGIEAIKEDPKILIPDGLFKAFGNVLTGLMDIAQNIDTERLLKTFRNIAGVVLIISSIIAVFNFNKLLKLIISPIEKVKKIVTSITDLFSTLQTVTKDVGKAIAMDLKADAFLKVAIGVAALAGVLIGLGSVDTVTLGKGIVALSVCVVTLAGAVALFNRTVPAESGWQAINTSLIQFGAAVGIMGGMVYLFGKMDYESLIKGLSSLTIVALLFTGIEIVLSQLPSRSSDAYKGIVGMALAMDILIPFITKIGDLPFWSLLKGILGLSVVIGELSVVAVGIGFLSREFNPSEVMVYSLSIAILSASMDILIPFMLTLSNLSFASWLEAIGGLILVISALSGAMLILSMIANKTNVADLAVTAASFAMMTSSINLLIPAIIAMAKISAVDETAVEKAVSMLALLTGALWGELVLLTQMNWVNVAVSAAAMGLVFLSITSMMPSLLALSSISTEKLMLTIGNITLLGLAVSAIVAILAYINTSTAGGVIWVALAFAGAILSMAVSISIAAAAIGRASLMFGTGLANVAKGLDRISKIDGEKFQNSMKNIVKGIGVLAEGIVELSPMIGNAIGQIITSILVKLLESAPDIINGIGEILRTVIENVFKNLFYVVSVAIVELVSALTTVLETLLEGGKNSIVARLVTIAIDSFLLVMDILVDRLGEIIAVIGDFIVALLDGAGQWLIDNSDKLIAAWVKFQAGLAKVEEEVYKYLKQVGKNSSDALIDGIKEKSNEAYAEITKWVNDRIDDFNRAFGIDKSDGKFVKLWKIGTGLVRSFILGILNLSAEIRTAGENFLKGFLEGLNFAFNDVKESVKEKAGDLVDVWKLGLGIHSPSKFTLETAINFLKGFDIGLSDKNENNNIFNKIKSFGGDVVSKLAESLGIDTEGGLLSNLFDTNSFDIESLLSDMSDNNEFSITPVLDTSEIYSDMDSLSSSFNSGDYDIGLSTSADLASSIGSYDDTVFTGSSSSTDISALTAEVQKISDKINRLEVRIDSGTLVGAIVDKMNSSLGERQILAGRGVLT